MTEQQTKKLNEEIERMKEVNGAMREQLTISTDLGQKRFEENNKLRDLLKEFIRGCYQNSDPTDEHSPYCNYCHMSKYFGHASNCVVTKAKEALR